MNQRPTPAIIFVPGMKPKPEPHLHGEQVWRCLVEGVRRVAPDVAEALEANSDCFELTGWTYLFYNEYRNIGLDQRSIERALTTDGPTEADRIEARGWRTRLKRFSYLLGDALPFLISRFADENMQITLSDVRRYVRNDDNIGRSIRRNLRAPLRRAWHADRPILLIGHSLGSVIAWDTLWELSRVDGVGGDVDTFLTLGSPLGQRVIQRVMKGSKEHGRRRYPPNIRHWKNLAAVGELTALDHRMAKDYAPMLALGLVDTIHDYRIYSQFRQDGELFVHSEYGYLLAEDTGRLIADFWKNNY